MVLPSGSLFARQFTGIGPALSRQFHAQGPSCARHVTSQARSILNIQRSVTAKVAATHSIESIPHKRGLPSIYAAAGIASVGLGLLVFSRPTIHCDSSAPAPLHPPIRQEYTPPPPPRSSVNFYELSFGTTCGLCAGIFIKKGAKAIAFLLGGVFVVLQYLGSASIVRVDWVKIGSRFEKLFYTKEDTIIGEKKAPSVYSLWNWLVDFLVADFQQRASFIAGFALGLRVG